MWQCRKKTHVDLLVSEEKTLNLMTGYIQYRNEKTKNNIDTSLNRQQ